MDYEKKHPISQEIYEYLKNTPKEQIDKDWSYILKETNPESCYEQKYKEALERARGLLEGMDEGDYFASNGDIENIFPELKESENERIRKEIRNFIWGYPNKLPERDKWLAWFEKQGEKKHIINVPPREVILSIWDLGNEWKERTNGCISTEYGTQLNYIQKHWHESEYYLKEKQGKQTQLDYEHADISQKDLPPVSWQEGNILVREKGGEE